MENRLRYLLEGHLNKTLTPDETKEFQEYVRSGENLDYIKNEIELSLNQQEAQQRDPGFGREIYARVLAENGIQKSVPNGFIWNLTRFAAAAMVILGLGLAWYFVPRKTENVASKVTAQPVLAGYKIYKDKSYIVLPDGSTVLLAENSQLTLIDKKGIFTREVVLRGEAFFDIAHDEGRKFIVHTGKVTTKVLGTAFHIKSKSGSVEVKVTRGLVEVGNDQKVFGKLHPKEQMIVSTGSNDFKISSLTSKEIRPSENSIIKFNEVALSSVFDQIGEKFHTHIFLENPEIGKCRISADFSGQDSLEGILGVICEMRQADFKVELDKILIKGGVACN